MEHDFEDIEVKQNAISLLDDALRRRRSPCMIGFGAMTDPYIPLENELMYTRRALETAAKYGFGVTLITKSASLLRDLDLFKEINFRSKCVVQMTLTTCDDDLCRKLEPNVSTTGERFEALMKLKEAGIPTVVWLCPILPFINDTAENINGILTYCENAGVKGIMCFGMGLTLREGNREYFYKSLDRLFPGLKEKYMRRYGNAYVLESPNGRKLGKIFRSRCSSAGIMHNNEAIFSYLGKFEQKDNQLSLF